MTAQIARIITHREERVLGLLKSPRFFRPERVGGYTPTLVHVRSFTDALTRYTRLFFAIVRRIRTRVARFVEANGTEKEQRNGRWRKAHASAPRSHVMRVEARIEAGATLARIKALRTACP